MSQCFHARVVVHFYHNSRNISPTKAKYYHDFFPYIGYFREQLIKHFSLKLTVPIVIVLFLLYDHDRSLLMLCAYVYPSGSVQKQS